MAYIDALMAEAEEALKAANLDPDRRPVLAKVALVAGPAGHDATVIVNGIDLSKYLSGFTVQSEVNDLVTVTLTFPAVVVHGYFDATTMADESRTYSTDDRPWWKRLLKRR